MKGNILFLLAAILLTSCSGSELFIDRDHSSWNRTPGPDAQELIYSIHLIGDAGSPSLDKQEPVLALFQQFLKNDGEQSAAIFLGDNIYLNGLPDTTHPNRSFYEARINEQLKTVEGYKGKVFFIPGNHDWDDGGKDGLAAIHRQERYIEHYLNRGNIFIPDNGFPGPVEIKLMDKDDHPDLKHDIRLVALDTQWWLHPFEKPFGDTGEYELTDAGDMINELQDIVRKRKNDYLIVAGHHPLISKERHGGYFPLKTHLKPPVFGSLYVLYRKIFGYKQDITHPLYSSMVQNMEEAFSEKEEIIYVSGHAHSLQYHRMVQNKRYTQHHLVSGAGSKTDFVADGRDSEFSYEGKGFLSLRVYKDGSVWMEAWRPKGDGSSGELLYRTQIQGSFGDPLEEAPEELPDYDYSDSTVVTAANPDYASAGPIKRALMGSNRRDLWAVESEFPVFDVTEVEGGLEVVRSGGKGQSNTLHLDGSDDREFVLRSVDKVAGKIWSDALRQTFALDVAQDQFSMLDPYAALVVSSLSGAAGVLHVEPTIYYVPDDPLLGEYGKEMAGTLALFEQKPDNDMSDVASVEYAEDVMGWFDMLREVDGDIDHRIDQPLMARSRLFDMFIGDWDRHYDQWRWAAVEPDDNQGKIYRPIPRDRDVALMKLNGFAPTLAKFGPFFQYQNTEESYGDLKGLNYNSLGITRRFTNQLTKEDWLTIAEELQQNLTDEAIESAVRSYPGAVYELHGEDMIRILKVRRDQLRAVTEQYYRLISKVVSIPASHKRERILITIPDEHHVRVQIYKLSGKGKLRDLYFDRTFNDQETRELRIFAMGDNDQIILNGKATNKIRLRIVGGAGNDEFIDEDPGIRKHVFVYDTEAGNSFELGKGAGITTEADPAINQYNMEDDYAWNSVRAKFYFNYNSNDGLFIGGGPKITRHSFRRLPAFDQYIVGNLAPLTMAATLKYKGVWYEVKQGLDISADGLVKLPGSFRYFYGLGNETADPKSRSINYYRGLLSQYEISGGLSKSRNETVTFNATTGLVFTDVKDVQGSNNILANPQAGVNPNIFNDQYYSATKIGFSINDAGHDPNPTNGVNFDLQSEYYIGLNEFSTNHTKLNSALSLYYTAETKRQVTYAGRVGGEHIIGAFPFYQSTSVGGSHNLRGFNNRRFSGRSSFYSNNELRFELFDIYNHYVGGKLGAITFMDIGRVWTDNENSSIWHKGYGGGIWFNLFDAVLVSGYFGRSKDSHNVLITAGFVF